VLRLSIITPIAYDYQYAYAAIRAYYGIADEIILGLDADRLTWSQKPYELDMSELRKFVTLIDTRQKIRIIEDNFHASSQPMENDSFERTELARHAQTGNWIVQIDSDEIIQNPGEFVDWLTEHNPVEYTASGLWISVFKVFGDQALVITPQTERTPIATMSRQPYQVARYNGQQRVVSPLQLLHFSWGRTRAELEQKLSNWGHAGEFDYAAYLAFWDSVTLENYTEFRDFHPLRGPMWHSLKIMHLERYNHTPSDKYALGTQL